MFVLELLGTNASLERMLSVMNDSWMVNEFNGMVETVKVVVKIDM